MNRSRRTLALAAIAVVGLPLASACLHLTEAANLPVYQFGAVSLRATSAAGSKAAATSTAIFFEAYSAGVPDSRNQTNTCVFSTVDTTTPFVTGVKKAGTAVSLQFGSNSTTSTVPLNFDSTFKRYTSSGTTTYSAGDSVKVNIPGETGGFPASTIAVRLAEPLIPGTVTLPTTAAPMTITWNASPDTTTAIIISLKYANPATSSYANQQILCALKDDGSETIPADAITAVLASPPALRSLLLTRWRTQVVTPDATSVLHIVSVMDTLVKMN
ncbi:MAG: hypothetical protein ABJC26_03785 [Gemmatimonadaceae bacterium]